MALLLRTAGIVLLLLLLLVVGLMAVLHTEWARERAAAYLSEELGREVLFAGPHRIAWSLRPQLTLTDVRVANAPWAEADTMARAEAVTVAVDLPALLGGELRLPTVQIDAPEVHLARAADGRTNWAFLTDDDDDTGADPQLERLSISDGRLRFSDAAHAIALDLAVAAQLASGAGQVQLEGGGEAAAEPFTLRLDGRTAAEAPGLTVDATLAVGEHRLSASGGIARPLELAGVDLALTAQGPDPQPLAERLGQELPALGDYQLRARLLYDEALWELRELAGRIGGSELTGALALGLEERPGLLAELSFQRMDLDALLGNGTDGQTEAETELVAPSAAELREALAPLREFDARLRLAVAELRLLGGVLEEVALAADLEAGRLDLQRLAARLDDGGAELAGWLEVGEQAITGELTAHLEQLNLDRLEEAPELLAGTADGSLRLQLTPELLLAGDSELRYQDAGRALQLQLELTTQAAEAAQPRTHLQVSGRRHVQDFDGELLAGPLLRLTGAADPAPLQARFRAGASELWAEGELDQLLTERRVEARFAARGDDLDGLAVLLGADLPELPPYEVQARVQGQRRHWTLREVEGQVGASDLAGDAELLLEPGQAPFVRAEITSRFLDIDDLTTETAEEREQGLAELLRSIDGELRFSGERVETERIPLEAVFLQARSDGARLELDPLEFRLGGGALRFVGALDAEQVPMRGQLEAEVAGVDLKEILPALGIDDDSAGRLSGRTRFTASGHDFASWLYSAAGELRLLMTGGQVDALLHELAGPEAAEQIMEFLLPEDEAILDLDCAFLAGSAERGLLGVESFFVTTPNINLLGQGELDLNAETVQAQLEGQSEEFHIMELLTPIEVSGPWAEPEITVITADLVFRGLAAALGALLPGAAAAAGVLGPLVAGLGDEPTPCHEIIEEALAEIEAL